MGTIRCIKRFIPIVIKIKKIFIKKIRNKNNKNKIKKEIKDLIRIIAITAHIIEIAYIIASFYIESKERES